MSNHKVCAVVVTYNRKKLLIECLESLKNQTRPLEGIYLIDNASLDGTSELLTEHKYIKELPSNYHENWNKCYNLKNTANGENIKFNYIRLSENTGGAGGFHEGVKRAYKDGYDWLWLMDDDAEPLNDALEKLSVYFDEKNVSALASVVKTTDNQIILGHRGYFDFKSIRNYKIVQSLSPSLINNNNTLKIDAISFVGVLINRKAIMKVGFPKKEFFVYGDDYEYSIRLRSVGEILLISDSTIQHKVYVSTNFIEKNFFGHKFNRIKYENYWISYFDKRNNVWLLKKYRRPLPYLWIMLVGSWLASIITIILFDDKKWKRIYFITAAYIDVFNDNFDNEKPKRILYN